jgi:hypothetical protein
MFSTVGGYGGELQPRQKPHTRIHILDLQRLQPNQSMQPTAGRRTAWLLIMNGFSVFFTRVVTSRG